MREVGRSIGVELGGSAGSVSSDEVTIERRAELKDWKRSVVK